jgi:hypothetical protein
MRFSNRHPSGGGRSDSRRTGDRKKLALLR